MAKKSKLASEFEESLRRPVPDETMPEIRNHGLIDEPVELLDVSPPRVESVTTQPMPLDPCMTYDELPEWFVAVHKADMDDVAARARVSGKTETTAIRTPIVGSGNMGTIVVYSDGTRLWSPHTVEVESWFGHLKR